METDSSQWCPVTGQEAMGTDYDTGKQFFTVRLVKHWRQLHSEVLESILCDIKISARASLGNLF